MYVIMHLLLFSYDFRSTDNNIPCHIYIYIERERERKTLQRYVSVKVDSLKVVMNNVSYFREENPPQRLPC